jgi:hypothetical protein
MRSKLDIRQAIGCAVALVFVAGIFYGCNGRDTLSGQKAVYGKNKPDPLTEEQLREFASSVRPVDGNAEAHYQLALHFQENHRHKLAIDELRQVLQRNPAHARAYNALGVSYDYLGDHISAIGSYRIALKIDPTLDYVYNNLGFSYLLNGQNAEAVDAFKQAIALNAKEKRYRNNLGLAYVKEDRYEQAYEQFRALDTAAAAEKTFAKVMQELGKDSQTETILLTVRSASSVQEKPEEPARKLPDLNSLENASPYSGPVARAQQPGDAVAEAPEPETPPAAPTDLRDPVVPVAAVEASEEPRAAEIQVPAPPVSEESPNELKVGAASAPIPDPAVAAPEAGTSYPIAAAALAKTPPVKYDLGAQILWNPPNPDQEEAPQFAPAKREPSRNVQASEPVRVSAASASVAGVQKATEPTRTTEKALIEIEVANGNGVKGSAARIAQHLRRSGFNVVSVTNAQSQDHFSTKVFHRGNPAGVQRVLDALPAMAADAELYELETMGDHIRVLVGKDLVGRNTALAWGMSKSIKPRTGG